MKKSYCYCLIFFVSVSLSAFSQNIPEKEKNLGIEFRNSSIESAKRLASDKHKLVFLEAYTVWSGPCKIMEKNIFREEQVGAYFNEHFICIRKDMEKDDGLEIAKKYNIKSYPTFLFLDSKGVVVIRSKGYMTYDEFLSLGKKAMDPFMHIEYLRNGAVKNPYNAKSVSKYLVNCYDPNSIVDSVIVNEFIAHLTDSALKDIPTLSILTGYGSVLKDQSWSLMKSKYRDLCMHFSNDTIDNLYKIFIERNLNEALRNGDKLKYPAVRNILVSAFADIMPEEELWWDDFNYSIRCSNKKEMLQLINTGVEKYFNDDIGQLNNLAWQIMEATDDLTLLNKADEVVKRSIELKEDNYNLDTRASILHKLGRNPEAKKLAEKSISIGRKNHEDIEETQALLEEIKLELRSAK
jgi:thioredoxin-related protein